MRARRITTVVVALVLLGTLQPQATAKKKPLPLQNKTCNALITQSFRLGSFPNSCTGNGLRIGAANITIDLGGNTLTGDGGEIGILNDSDEDPNTGFDGAVVKNGEIRGFDNGIQQDAAHGTFKKLTILDNDNDGIHSSGGGNVVKRNLISGNGFHGVLIGGPTTPRSLVIDNEIVSNTDKGILTSTLGFVDIESNEVHGNGGAGIVSQGNDVRIVNNTVRTNGQAGAGGSGIWLTPLASDTITKGNAANGNGRHGYLDEGTNNDVRDNVLRANGYFQGASNGIGLGIDASGATTPSGEDNVATANDDNDECNPAAFCF